MIFFSLLFCLAFALTSSVSYAKAQEAKASERVAAVGAGASEDSLLDQEQAQFRAAAKAVAPCVVQIETFGGLERVADELVTDGPTTGTIVGKDGWIISSLYSFRQQPGSILVTLPSGTRVPAKIVARDHSRELALLKVESQEELPVPATLKRADLVVGQWVVALGRTFDKGFASQSVGIISALDRAYGKAIQTDAKVSPINYGGPLVDLSGRVVGILAPISPGAILEGDSSQLYDSGVGFAIPLEDILARLEQMKSGRDIYGGKLGIVATQQNELAGPVIIAGATPGSPAARSGVRAGDVIVAAAGQPVEILAHLRHALGPVDAGSEFRFAVRRKGQVHDFQATLVKDVPVYHTRFLGLRAETVDENLGARITAVEAGSPAAQAGLVPNWTITQCSGESIKSTHDLRVRVAMAELDQPLKLSLKTLSGEEKEVSLTATTWPVELAQPPVIDPASSQQITTKVLALPLGDFPNKAWAVVPSNASMLHNGLLVLLPEPGEVDQQKLQSQWEAFAKERGWIVAIIAASNPKQWSMEEVELIGRVIGKLEDTYRIDASRTAIGGLGVGGRLALMGARLQGEKIAGVATLGTNLDGFNWRQANSPLQSLRFMLAGAEAIEEAATKLRALGYPVALVASTELSTPTWESIPQELMIRWLLGLDRI